MPAQSSPDDLDFGAVFAALPGATAVFAADPPRFTILAASDALLAVAKRPRDAIVGRPVADAFPNSSPHDPEGGGLAGLRDSLAAAVRTGSPQQMKRQRYDLQRPDGVYESRYWDAMNTPVLGPDGAVRWVLHQTTDVTTQVRGEAAAAQAERRAEQILESMSDAHCVLDRDYRIVGVNAAAERLLGRSRETLLGRSHWEVFPASFDAPVGRAFRRVVAEGVEQHLTHHYTGEGYDLHLEVDAYPTDEGGLAMFWRDVTERVRAQAAREGAAATDAYRVALTDALRRAEDPAEAQAVAMRVLGDHLGAARVMFGEADPQSADTFTNHREYRRDLTMPTSLGRYRWDDFGPYVAAEMLAGRTLAVDEVRTHPGHSAEELARFEAVGIRAYVAVPLVREGRIAAYLAVNHTTPHPWTAEEIGLIEETAERTWAAVERACAQAGLRASEEKYRALFNEMDEAYAVVEVMADASGRWTDFLFLDVNPAFMRHTGMPYPVGRTATQLLGTPNPRWAELYGRAAETGESIRLEEPELTLGRVFDLNIFRLGGQGSRRVAVLFTDITERRRAEAALRESEEKYRTLFSEMDEGFAICELVRDPDGRAVDYRYVDLNPAVVRHVNIEPSTLRGRRAGEMFTNLDPWLIETYARVVDERESVVAEHYFPHVDLWLRLNAFPRGGDRFAVLYSNISEHKRAEQALRESERRYRLLFESMGDGFALCEVIRDERGRIVDWRYLEVNRAWEQTGVPVSETVGRTAREVNPEIEPEWIEVYGRVVETGLSVNHEAFAKGFGKRFDTVAFKHSENCFGLIFRDVTARREAEAALRESEQRQAFLLKLSDALRPLRAAAEIQGEATRLLREHLAAGWCYYVEWDESRARGVVLLDATREGLPSLAGTHDVSDVPAFLDLLRTGTVLNVGDYARFDGLSPKLRARYTALGFRAMLVGTLVKQGRLVASLIVGDTVVRDWSSDAEVLLMEVAERTWAAVERARAEAALRASEERRLLGLDAAGIGDWAFEVATGLLDCSPRARSMHGVGPDEPVTVELHDGLIDPGDRGAVQAARARALDPACGTYCIEFRFHAAGDFDGEVRWIESVGRGVFEETADGPRPTHLIGAMIDVTERRRAEEALRESEARYRSLFETMGQGYSELELRRDADGRVIDERWVALNPAFERIFGIPVERAVGRWRSELFPGLEPWWEESFDRVARSGVPERVEYESPSIGGWYEMWVYPRGGDRLIVLYEDITERKRAEAVLRESEDRQAFLLTLSDALRAEPDADAIATRALGMLADRLQADRCYVGVYKVAEDRGEHGPQVGNDRVPPVPAVVRLSDFPEAVRLASDHTVAFDDVAATNALTEADRRNLSAVGIRGLVVATLRRTQKEPLWCVAVVSADPRRWTAGEVALIEETAERTWAAIERARAEAALRASEEQFRRAIEDAPIPVIMHAEDGEVLQVSRTWSELTGYRIEDVPTFDAWLTRAYGEGAEAVREHVRGLFAGRQRRMTVEFPVRTRGGGLRYWSFSASVPGTLQDGRRFIVGMALDITQRLRAESELRASEARYRHIVDGARDYAIFTLDREGHIDSWASGAQSVFGWAAAEALGKQAAITFVPEDVAAGVPAQERAEAVVHDSAADVRWHQRKDGTRVFIEGTTRALRDERGELRGFLKIGQDVTARRQLDESLRAAEARYRALLENVQDYAIFGLDANGHINAWTAGAERVKGYAAAEVLGQHVAIFYTPEDVAAGAADRHLEEAREKGRGEWEGWRVRKDGSRFWVNEIATVIRGQDGEVVGFTKISRDLSERKREAEARERLLALTTEARREAEAANRAKDEFLATLSHELRTPLAPILLWSRALSRGGVPPKDLSRALDAIVQSAESQSQLIEDLLDLSRLQSGKLALEWRRTDLNDLSRSALEVVRPTAEAKGVALKAEVTPGLADVVLDPARFRQVLWNLLSNSVKFTPAGGRVSLRMQKHAGELEAEVADTGQGIPPRFSPASVSTVPSAGHGREAPAHGIGDWPRAVPLARRAPRRNDRGTKRRSREGGCVYRPHPMEGRGGTA